MIGPFRASYGARDDMHDALAWDGPGSLPPGLLGLTDKPPGSLAPGERWWPSVGCGPVGGWWALWWTRPDDRARRGGMVRSEVALWRLDQVGDVDDLRPVLESLGETTVVPPADRTLAAVSESLLLPDITCPILSDLDIWPGVIAALWARLWPAIRPTFSARVATSPPQGGESVAQPWLFCIPPSRAPQWSEYPQIKLASQSQPTSRAARWFAGRPDAEFEEVLSECSPPPENLRTLGQVARAAERLELLRAVPTAQHALDLLRTLTVLAPRPSVALDLKREALNVLALEVAYATAGFVSSLANLEVEKLPEDVSLERALAAWTSCRAPELPIEDVVGLLTSKAREWWQRAVRGELSRGFAEPDRRWARTALHWLGEGRAALALRSLLPATPLVEQRLVDAVEGAELTASEFEHLRQQTAERGWPRLHAWAVLHTQPPRDALRVQRARFGAQDGLDILIARLPGDAVVDEAIARPDPQLMALVARRTVAMPELLDAMNAAEPAWRSLWAAHVAGGGAPWPPAGNRGELVASLLGAVLAGQEPSGLVVMLADDLVNFVVEYAQRTELWAKLSDAGRAALVPRVAEAVLARCESGHAFASIERPLADAVIERARRVRICARGIAMLLHSELPLDEQEMIRWLNGVSRSDLAVVVESVGRAALARRWRRTAEVLYGLRLCGAEFQRAAELCQELLPSWQRAWLTWSGRTSDAALARRLAEIGAALAPDGLDDLWERAGGRRGQLKTGATPEVRWREATALAEGGALQGRLGAIARELRVDFLYNDDLRELQRLLAERARRDE